MRGLLADRMALYLSQHPNRSVREIASELRAKESTVRQILGSSGVFLQHDGPGKPVTYSLGIEATQALPVPPRGLPADETDKAFLLRVLSDGKPHNLNEILRRSLAERGCGLTVHSRAADLRADDHDVRNWKDGERGNGSWYRLALEETGRVAGGEPAPCPVSSSAAGPEPQNRPEHDSLPASGARSFGGRTEPITPGAGATAAEQLVLSAPEFRRKAVA